ncbi:MAG TPA: hypothetical protein VFN41_06080 [Candidatus Limnocylindrales bacterium]|nr:hypothetical protein [Candidatus Limnocylindrales bacterium]
MTQAAEAESQRIIEEAHADADRIRAGADDYAVSVLEGLEGDVQRTLQSIQKGIGLLDERRATLQAAPSPFTDEDLAPGDGELVEGDHWDDEAEEPAAPART